MIGFFIGVAIGLIPRVSEAWDRHNKGEVERSMDAFYGVAGTFYIIITGALVMVAYFPRVLNACGVI